MCDAAHLSGCAADELDAVVIKPFCEIARDVRRAVVGEQPRPMRDMRLIKAGGL